MITLNTYKQTLDQVLDNTWNKDAYICETTCGDMEV